ncbi:MAG: ATP-binding protein [bacterium]
MGREQQLRDLRCLLRKRSPSLVTCRGRRRIGKSTLIREFGKEADRFLEFEGLPPRPGLKNTDQLATFSEQLARQTMLPRVALNGWPQALQLLASTLGEERTVILLDEISWLGGFDPDFAGHLKTAWDRLFRRHAGLVLVLCGSVSAWIEQNILRSTGFVGRTSWDLILDELPLTSCDFFWGKNRHRIEVGEKLTVLSVTGGVPRYLEEIDPGLSADENIRHLCFRPEGMLFREFDQIFSDIFGKHTARYREILRSLASGSRSVSEISGALGKERSGHLTTHLNDLVLAGFVARDQSFDPKSGQVSRTAKYRLRDNYSRFYLRYIEPRRERIEADLMHQTSPAQLPEWDTVLGLQFENLVLSNIGALTELLGIAKTPVLSASPYVQRATARWKGCQVDLLIVTKHSLYIVEIKRRKRIGLEVVGEVEEKIRRMKSTPGRSVRTALVYQGVLASAVEEEGYFDFVIPFATFLGMAG